MCHVHRVAEIKLEYNFQYLKRRPFSLKRFSYNNGNNLKRKILLFYFVFSLAVPHFFCAVFIICDLPGAFIFRTHKNKVVYIFRQKLLAKVNSTKLLLVRAVIVFNSNRVSFSYRVIRTHHERNNYYIAQNKMYVDLCRKSSTA